jgi:hypothetical protein
MKTKEGNIPVKKLLFTGRSNNTKRDRINRLPNPGKIIIYNFFKVLDHMVKAGLISTKRMVDKI